MALTTRAVLLITSAFNLKMSTSSPDNNLPIVLVIPLKRRHLLNVYLNEIFLSYYKEIKSIYFHQVFFLQWLPMIESRKAASVLGIPNCNA